MNAIYIVIFFAIIRFLWGYRVDKKNKNEPEEESAKSLERKQNGQEVFAIYKEAASNLPFDEQTKIIIALKAVSILDDKQTKKLIKRHKKGKEINLPFDEQELLRLSKEAKEYINEVQAKKREEQWQNYLNRFRAYNKAQQDMVLEKLKKEGVADERLFTLKMIQLESKTSQSNQDEVCDSSNSDCEGETTQTFLEYGEFGDNGKSKRNNWTWVYIVLAVIAVLFIVGLIGDFISQKRLESSVRQEVNDVNYCRSYAAQYGQQGTAAFSNTYNACMTGKGW